MTDSPKRLTDELRARDLLPESGPVMTDASIEQHIRETLPTAMPTNTWSNEFVRALLRRLDAARESEKAALDALNDAYSVLRMQDRSKAWIAERDRRADGARDLLQKAGR